MIATATDLQQQAINTIRTVSIDAVQQAESGHPGLPMGAAAMAYTLWQYHLRHNPQNPAWINRDRFVLSAGHGSMLIYALLHLTGYDLPLDEIKNFRQMGSKTPGHPEYGLTPGVETTTGPLGQGGANAVGLALAEAFLADHFNRPGHPVIDHRTYAIVSDGDMMEGVFMEASALAGHWGLHKLTFLYDANKVTLDGQADMTFTEDIAARYQAWDWHVLRVTDGNDTNAVDDALKAAQANTDQPTLIIVETVIGYGSPNKAGKSAAHGSPLGPDEVTATKQAYGWPTDTPFYIPDDALNHFREAVARGREQESAWEATFAAWKTAHPDLAYEWERAFAGHLPEEWDDSLPVFTPDDGPIATRNALGDALRAIARNVKTLIGGDADLAGSTKTLIDDADSTGKDRPTARNLRFGVREHGMGAIVNGLALHGGIIRPYSATFLTFSDYMRPAIRLGSLMEIPATYIFTHDSIGLGEDGPTHQPVEHVMSLRLIPHLHVFRPADANEASAVWRTVMALDMPCAVIGTRQKLPVLANHEMIHEGVAHGAYTLADCEGTPQVILLATGSEVHIALEAHQQLLADGIKTRVVSMPCWELFEQQDATYKESVLPADVTARVSIEAGVTLGWERYVGMYGVTIGVDRFGESAPYQEIYQAFGLTPERVVEAAHGLL